MRVDNLHRDSSSFWDLPMFFFKIFIRFRHSCHMYTRKQQWYISHMHTIVCSNARQFEYTSTETSKDELKKPCSAPGFEHSTLDLLTPYHQASGEHLPYDFSLLSDRYNLPFTGGHWPLEDRLEAVANLQFWPRSEFIQSVYAQQEYPPTAWLISSRYGARTPKSIFMY